MGLLVFSTEKSVRSRGKCVRLHFHWKTVSSRLLVFCLFILCVFFVSFFCLSHTSLVTWTASHSSLCGCGAGPESPSWQQLNNSNDRVSTNRWINLFFFFFSMEEGYIISSLEPQPLLSVVMGVLKMYDPYKWDTGWNANEKERETWLFFCFVDLLLFLKTHLVY